MVYVISKDGKPLMPCENVVARLLLKAKKAKVVKKEPFTIKLNYETTEYTQNLTLGVDLSNIVRGAKGDFTVPVVLTGDDYWIYGEYSAMVTIS